MVTCVRGKIDKMRQLGIWGSVGMRFVFFFFNFLFHVGKQPVNSVVVLGDIKGTQPYTYMYPFSLKLPSHPGLPHNIGQSSLC